MAIPDVAWDGGAAMTNQPAEIAVAYLPPPEDAAVNGGDLAIPWDHNRRITMKWLDTPTHGTLAELLSARNSKGSHTVTWNDPAGTGQTCKVHWHHPPSYTIVTGQIFGEITIELRERPD
jgi:hypothetical protein